MSMTALVDADIILYEIGFASQVKIDGDIFPDPVEEVNQRVDNKIKEICAAVYATEDPVLYLTGKGNFRYDIAKQRDYKGNRKQIKPFHYNYIKAYLQAKWGAIVVDGMEADDALAIHQTARIKEKDTIICSRDKDLKQVPGFHYGWECGKQGSFGPEWVDELGGIRLVSPKKLVGTGYLFFLSQVLTGDSTDTYDGAAGCGPIGARDVLEGAGTYADGVARVLEYYEKKYPENGRERMKEQAQLAWMVRELDADGKPVMWEFPQ